MPATSFTTKVGSTSDVRPSKSEVVVVSEPETGAQLRTKGRLYLLCEVAGPGSPTTGMQVAREVADLTKQEYYYDLSGGIEVSLRRALRQANRRAYQKLKEGRARISLHIACAVVVNNEIYGSRVGAAQVFLVRRARLFLPGDEPGELADFVHRTSAREAASLGTDGDVVPKVWRQTIEPGDTLIIAASALIDGLGAEALKSAAVTLHPRAAADHIHNRAVADGVEGSDAALFVELTQSAGAAARVASAPASLKEPTEVVIAETIRSRIDAIWRHRQRIGGLVKTAASPVASAATKGVAVGLELMPKRGATLPRHPDTARQRSLRQRRAVTSLAVVLLLAAVGVGGLAYRDYESNRAGRDYQNAVLSAEDSLASAHRLADRKPPDPAGARARIAAALAKVDEASRSPLAEKGRLDALRADAALLEDRLDGVVIDLDRIAAGSKPLQIIGNVNGLYVADPGAGRLWRIFGDPLQTGVVMQRGDKGVGAPSLLTWQSDVLFVLDDSRKIWRAEGNQVNDVTPDDNTIWKSTTAIAVFTQNLYVLDAASGQLWKHESPDSISFTKGTAYLATPLVPNTAASLAIDGDVWIVTTTNEIQRFRRNPLALTAGRVDFTPKWQGETVRPAAIQAVNGQTNIYVLDPAARYVVQLSRDGRELLRVALPPTLAAATAFYVSEGSRVAYTVHGSKIVATSLDR
ncbi:MAG: hypothetical protein E6I57_00950 [Chloroflexi bacterium]|nr:MAG: hypothetical protein E6J19_12250 [Chloroflexota bacterium]TME43678.1 MAG: hypothetical protein E6I57_00950 [Chloroflexota bacterium]